MIIKEINPLYCVYLSNDDLAASNLFRNHGVSMLPNAFEPMENTVMVNMALFLFMVQALINPRNEACSGARYRDILDRMGQRRMERVQALKQLDLGALRAVLSRVHDYEYVYAFRRTFEYVLPIEFNRLEREARAWQYAYSQKIDTSDAKWTAFTLEEIRQVIARDLLRDARLIYQGELAQAFVELKEHKDVASTYRPDELTVNFWEDLREGILDYWKRDLLPTAQ